MSRNMRENEPLPEWIRVELERMQDPPAAELAKYNSIKKEFLQALRGAAAAEAPRRDSGQQRTIDAVFTLAGKLLRWADEQVKNVTEAERAQPVPLLTRGFGATDKPQAERVLVAKVCKQHGEFLIEAATYKATDFFEIEINVVKRADGAEVRPLVIGVVDQDGRVISEPVHVDRTGQAPRFPGPAAGVYRFQISWAGDSAEIQIEFCQESPQD